MLTSSPSAADGPAGHSMDTDSPFEFDEELEDPSTSYFNDDVRTLTQWWVNERCAPEILPYQDELVRSLLEMVEAQTSILETKTSDTADGAFLNVLYQQEMERIKFVIRSYLRTRLAKIQKYTAFFLREPEFRGRLSEEELAFAENLQQLLEKHFTKSCLEGLPPFLTRLDDQAGDSSMVSMPDLEDAVICRILEDIGEFQLEDSSETIVMRKNNIYILRYKSIRRLLEEDKVELL
ncbi:uncharacterized protein EV422DRAFT_427775 [Fimicolochytrium jonesii]|uniref:uncharacterized protein n=1 Tax=Fimicolochytrium jonesii TaxID=1396493 RepID=UPI0022FDBA01|nr:uncharacterized protein EV422DRAFT_427775 [Fimicolochytrium jonesii]KAI8821680.1 hypothetical protein EV422DRAFT_427775 [Fimicolochytrium jonesii]